MRLVFVHGINQEDKDPDELKDVWIGDVEKGLQCRGALGGVHVDMPYFGNILKVGASRKGHRAIAQGPNGEADLELAEFLAAGMDEQAKALGITDQQIAEEQDRMPRQAEDVVAMGFPMNRRINAIFRLIEQRSKVAGDLALRLLDQAHAYLRKPGVASKVDEIVAPVISGGPIVLVTHSLGSVVTFKLMRQFAIDGCQIEVPLYVTLGSPLPLSTVRRALGPDFANPAGVARWINARDRDDVITLNRGLNPPDYPGPIKNWKGVRNVRRNGAKDAHAIPGYLAYPPVARAIAKALGLVSPPPAKPHLG